MNRQDFLNKLNPLTIYDLPLIQHINLKIYHIDNKRYDVFLILEIILGLFIKTKRSKKLYIDFKLRLERAQYILFFFNILNYARNKGIQMDPLFDQNKPILLEERLRNLFNFNPTVAINVDDEIFMSYILDDKHYMLLPFTVCFIFRFKYIRNSLNFMYVRNLISLSECGLKYIFVKLPINNVNN